MERDAEALQIRRFETAAGAQIFQIPLLAFPGLWGYAYLVFVEHGSISYRVLIDAGSGFGESNRHLETGFQQVSAQIGQSFGFENLTHIFITHGHIDHFGGLSYICPRTQALLGVHELDLRNLTSHEERLTIVSRRLRDFLFEAGVSPASRQNLINLYMITKSIYRSVPVDFTYEAIGMRLGPFEMLHVPGHCAGHVAIRLDDILFSGDHVLTDTSPHQSPEQITLSTGIDHYLKSLERLRIWAKGTRLTLPGHKRVIEDLDSRMDEIRQVHRERLLTVLGLLKEPHTVQEISKTLFKEVRGYNTLLALEETGAHVEYLYQRGLLCIENIKELDGGFEQVPVRYRCLPCGAGGPPDNLSLF